MSILIAESLDIHKVKSLIDQDERLSFYTEKPSIKPDDKEIHFIYRPDITPEALLREIKDYQAVIVRPKAITIEMINQGKNLKLIIRGGAGVNAIDCQTAKANGIIVENTPGLNSTATAEYSFALMLELLTKRNIHMSHQDCLKNKAKQPEVYIGSELAGKKIGIIGLGNIGMRMATRCAAFDMEVYGYNRSPKKGPFIYVDQLEHLAEKSLDILSLHIPLTEQTKHLINERFLNRLPKPIILINTARPQLVEPTAFSQALESGKIISAGIDGDEDVIAPFLKADTQHKCLITPHIADATYEAQVAIAEAVIKQACAFFLEGKIINRVA